MFSNGKKKCLRWWGGCGSAAVATRRENVLTHITAALRVHEQQFWVVEDRLGPIAPFSLLEGLFGLLSVGSISKRKAHIYHIQNEKDENIYSPTRDPSTTTTTAPTTTSSTTCCAAIPQSTVMVHVGSCSPTAA